MSDKLILESIAHGFWDKNWNGVYVIQVMQENVKSGEGIFCNLEYTLFIPPKINILSKCNWA